ncbi:hypothetical protein [Chitinophaga nivalis]|uniref:DUF4848 domain-containing protein n=1 Tax=Chitinophaga nivalis TaxID=2991709 RepID=A0ABT3ITL2_9BACT|nr:hypothetical protein [Chitinophaga nivalis]MCW3462978.1 hypothetical protein [Chitinophaga nivalis]MCW3487332.1 hypothetical protein [Chitinophaga nivalis]
MKTIYCLKLILLFFAFFTFSGCRKDAKEIPPVTADNQQNEPVVEHGRLYFSSQESFNSYIRTIFNKKVTDKEGFTSLATRINTVIQNQKNGALPDEIKDFRDFGFPQEFLFTLNGKGEVRIGNDIIWYHGGRKYLIPISNENSLEEIKQQPSAITTSFDTRVVKLGTINPLGKIDLGLSGVDSRHIKEFYLWGNTLCRFVHEVATFYENTGGNNWTAYLVLRIKMEWKDCCKWNPATTIRDVKIDVSGTANLYNGVGTIPAAGTYILGPDITLNETEVVSNDYTITLSAINGSGALLSGSHWALRLQGTIFHYAQNDYNYNAWTNAGTPLW